MWEVERLPEATIAVEVLAMRLLLAMGDPMEEQSCTACTGLCGPRMFVIVLDIFLVYGRSGIDTILSF